MMYALKGANYLFGFITIPYLTRVLGAEVYGQIGFATAFSMYVQLILDFGFVLSATAEVARCDGDRARIARINTSVAVCKTLLCLACCAAVLPLLLFVQQFSADPLLFVLYFAYVYVNALVPDFVYRGIEQMTIVAVRTVVIKAVFLIGVFVFVKEASQYHLVPVFYLIGALVALIAVLAHMKRSLGIWFAPVSLRDVAKTFASSVQYFVSRIASTFYSSMNMIVLGALMPGSAALGHYSACNNVVNAGKSLGSPIADSIFPYMIRTKNYRLLLKILLIGEIVAFPTCAVVAVFAPELCGWFFGEDFYDAGRILRIMVFLIPVSFAAYLLGFPALTPMNRAKVANYSVIIGAVAQVLMVAALFMTGALDALSICVATLITESTVLVVRTVSFVRGFHEGCA